MAVCTEPAAIPCEDQVFQQMNLQNDVSPGAVTNEADGAGFISSVDATAGGAFNPDPPSYTYGKFTETGLQKVDITDEESLLSMDWDIAFRRYVVRINSGNSGPSCVAAARYPDVNMAPPVYEDIMDPPATPFHTDDYFTAECQMIPDGNGLMGSPATALTYFWSYPGCVKMTDNVFAVRLADGRMLKLRVDSYYEPTAQEQCDTMNSVPMMGSGAANYRVRWAFLP